MLNVAGHRAGIRTEVGDRLSCQAYAMWLASLVYLK